MFALVLLRCQEKFVPVNGYPLFMVDDFFESGEAGGDEMEKPQSAFGGGVPCFKCLLMERRKLSPEQTWFGFNPQITQITQIFVSYWVKFPEVCFV